MDSTYNNCEGRTGALGIQTELHVDEALESIG